MLIAEFIEGLNKLATSGATSLKDKFIEERITRHYVPVMEKKKHAEEVLRASIITEKNNVYVDSIINEINFIYTIFSLYTDITPPLGDDNTPSPILMYDALKSTNTDEEILPRIGKDLLEYRYINEQTIEMWEKNKK